MLAARRPWRTDPYAVRPDAGPGPDSARELLLPLNVVPELIGLELVLLLRLKALLLAREGTVDLLDLPLRRAALRQAGLGHGRGVRQAGDDDEDDPRRER